MARFKTIWTVTDGPGGEIIASGENSGNIVGRDVVALLRPFYRGRDEISVQIVDDTAVYTRHSDGGEPGEVKVRDPVPEPDSENR